MTRRSFKTGIAVPDDWHASKATLFNEKGKVVTHDQGLEYLLTPNGTVLTQEAGFATRHPVLAAGARGAGYVGMALGSFGLGAPALTAQTVETGKAQYVTVMPNAEGGGGACG